MNNMQVTSTGIAVALAVVVALGLLFFGPRVFAPLSSSTPEYATTTLDIAPSNSAPMDTSLSSEPLPTTLPTSLTVTDSVVGTGAEAVPGAQVTVNYTGRLPDGTIFDSSIPRGQAFTFNLGGGQVIKGWDQGIVGMKEGGTRRLIIPSDLAYGNQAVGDVIPANATLIFDVELLDVQ